MSVDALEAPTNEHLLITPASYPNLHIGEGTPADPAESTTQRYVVNLPESYGSESVEMITPYRDLAVDGNRRPLLRAPDMHRFIGNEHPGRPAPDYGDLMLEITLPNGGDLTMPDDVRTREYFDYTMYVFKRDTKGGPEYTVVNPATLYEATVNPEAAEANSAVLRLNRNSNPVTVGTEKGCWMPGVGYDTDLLERNRIALSGRRTVSRMQGVFYVDRRGNFHYAESAQSKNNSDVRLNKTMGERAADRQHQAETQAQFASYPGRLVTKLLVNGRPQPSPPEVLSSVAIQEADLVSRGSTQRTYGGELVGDRYTGRHRRQNWLGRLATKFFGWQ